MQSNNNIIPLKSQTVETKWPRCTVVIDTQTARNVELGFHIASTKQNKHCSQNCSFNILSLEAVIWIASNIRIHDGAEQSVSEDIKVITQLYQY